MNMAMHNIATAAIVEKRSNNITILLYIFFTPHSIDLRKGCLLPEYIYINLNLT